MDALYVIGALLCGVSIGALCMWWSVRRGWDE